MLLDIPLLGLGTWELQDKECTDVIKLALELGYRHIDTAHLYKNHSAVGRAIHGFDRSALFITSKFTLDQIDFAHVQSSVEKSCEVALKELGTDYLNLYLIHWPNHELAIDEVFKALEKLVQKGKVLLAGVSNFTIHHLEDLRRDKCHPKVNQVEFHPLLYQKKLWEYCLAHCIQLIAYRPLGKKKLINEALFKEMGHRYEKSPAQIILRWLIQKKIPIIPKASTKRHLQENLEIFDFSLTEEDMDILDHLNKNQRFCGADDPEFNY
jgi:diketogulonate reductase-like aldo/keto reductase